MKSLRFWMRIRRNYYGEFSFANLNREGEKKMGNEYFVGWGTLALINAALAQGKNRTGLNWFLLSLFLGPLATFILLFVEKR